MNALSHASTRIFIFFSCTDLQVDIGMASCSLNALTAIQAWGDSYQQADPCLWDMPPSHLPHRPCSNNRAGCCLWHVKSRECSPGAAFSLPQHICSVQAPPCIRNGRKSIPLNIHQAKEELFPLLQPSGVICRFGLCFQMGSTYRGVTVLGMMSPC